MSHCFYMLNLNVSEKTRTSPFTVNFELKLADNSRSDSHSHCFKAFVITKHNIGNENFTVRITVLRTTPRPQIHRRII